MPWNQYAMYAPDEPHEEPDEPEHTAPPLYTVRRLPVTEWDRLREMPFAANGMPNPDLTAILVAETPEGRIVGVWAAMTQVFLDGLWIDPAYRRRTWVAVKLLHGMKRLLASIGVQHSFMYTLDTDVLLLAHKAGFRRLPGDLCVLELKEVN